MLDGLGKNAQLNLCFISALLNIVEVFDIGEFRELGVVFLDEREHVLRPLLLALFIQVVNSHEHLTGLRNLFTAFLGVLVTLRQYDALFLIYLLHRLLLN